MSRSTGGPGGGVLFFLGGSDFRGGGSVGPRLGCPGHVIFEPCPRIRSGDGPRRSFRRLNRRQSKLGLVQIARISPVGKGNLCSRRRTMGAHVATVWVLVVLSAVSGTVPADPLWGDGDVGPKEPPGRPARKQNSHSEQLRFLSGQVVEVVASSPMLGGGEARSLLRRR